MGTPWLDSYGMKCERVASCSSSSGDSNDTVAHGPVKSPLGDMETCLCKTVSWPCIYDNESCALNDTYYPPAPLNVSKLILKSHIVLHHTSTDYKPSCSCSAFRFV